MRVRPLSASEASSGLSIACTPESRCKVVVKTNDEGTSNGHGSNGHGRGLLSSPDHGDKKLSANRKRNFSFNFDRIFNTNDSQGALFAEVSPLVTSCCDGYNVCVFAFGQTGSGKTHTMFGEGYGPDAVASIGSVPGPSIVAPGLRGLKGIGVDLGGEVPKAGERATESSGDEVGAGAGAGAAGVALGKEAGLLPRTVRALFAELESRVRNDRDQTKLGAQIDAVPQIDDSGASGSGSGSGAVWLDSPTADSAGFAVHVELLEVYRDGIFDLLGVRAAKEKGVQVKLNQNHGINEVTVENGTVIAVESAAELLGVISQGMRNRAVASTKMNASSSRSHVVTRLTVQLPGGRGAPKRAVRMTLVDLAGSERVEKSGVTGDQLKEAQSINKSLSALADVVGALTGNAAHVPYRNHPLTMLMADCIGGSAKTCMLLCCSPHADSANETINSLNFAKRCKGITNNNIGRNMAINNINASIIGGGGGARLERKASDASLKSYKTVTPKTTKFSPGAVSRAQQVLQDSTPANSNGNINHSNHKKSQPKSMGGKLERKPSDADIATVQRWCEDELQRLKEVNENTAAGTAALSPGSNSSVDHMFDDHRAERPGGKGRGAIGGAQAPGSRLSAIGRPEAAGRRPTGSTNGNKFR